MDDVFGDRFDGLMALFNALNEKNRAFDFFADKFFFVGFEDRIFQHFLVRGVDAQNRQLLIVYHDVVGIVFCLADDDIRLDVKMGGTGLKRRAGRGSSVPISFAIALT